MNDRLLRMIPNLPLRNGLWIDCYNQGTSNIAGTITAGIYKRNLQFVMTKEPTIGAIRTRSYCGQPMHIEQGGEQSNALTSAPKDNIVLEPINTDINGHARTITTQYGKKGWDSMLNSDRDKLTCVCDTYRIRKLTPRECFRLMGVSEPDIDTLLSAGISDSQLYKLAGNSIVVDVLCGIFDRMLVNTEPTELTLF